MIHIMQGDAYPVILDIYDKNDEPITGEDAAVVEVMIGSIYKKTPDGVRWDTDEQGWAADLTQQDTIGLKPGTTGVQARVKTANGHVEGWHECGKISVDPSRSEEIL